MTSELIGDTASISDDNSSTTALTQAPLIDTQHSKRSETLLAPAALTPLLQSAPYAAMPAIPSARRHLLLSMPGAHFGLCCTAVQACYHCC